MIYRMLELENDRLKAKLLKMHEDAEPTYRRYRNRLESRMQEIRDLRAEVAALKAELEQKGDGK